jgi:hypothetical protein
VLAIVQSRLEALPGEARLVLRAASVFGQTFWRGGATALAGGAQRSGSLSEWLSHLVDVELVTRRAASKFAGEEEYAFRHSLVHEAAYAMLTPQDRALGHRLAAEWLERVGASDALLVAEHYERGGAAAKAIGAYLRACEQALEGNDLASATLRAERGIACGAEGEVRGALLLRLAEAHLWRGAFGEAAELAGEASGLLGRNSPLAFAALGAAATARATSGDEPGFSAIARDLLQSGPENELALGPYVVALASCAARFLYLGRYADLELALAAIERSVARFPWQSSGFAGWVEDARSTGAMAR